MQHRDRGAGPLRPEEQQGRRGFDLFLGHLDVDPTHFVFQLEEDHAAAAVSENAVTVVFDDAGDAAYFSAVNRGKRALGLDLARPEGRAVLEALLKDADILVENYLPGTMERWNLGYDDVLSARHPRLVYCAISGFGADGPLGGLPGYDAVLQAMSGLMSINGTQESGPTRVGVPIVDYVTGYNALTGILLALAARQQTGKGQRVDVTLFDTALSLLVPHAANWLSSGRTPGRLGSAHPNIAPYDKFAAGDGELFLGIVNDGQFRRFCRQVKREDLLEDPRFVTNAARLQHAAVLRSEIERTLASFKVEDLCHDLMRSGVSDDHLASVIEARSQPNSASSGRISTPGMDRTAAAQSIATKVTATTIQP